MRAVRTIFIAFVEVLDAIPERIGGLSQAPAETLDRIIWIADDARVSATSRLASVPAFQPVPARHFPVVVLIGKMVLDAREGPFDARLVAPGAVRRRSDEHQLFRS
jgi:hypothetical protein